MSQKGTLDEFFGLAKDPNKNQNQKSFQQQQRPQTVDKSLNKQNNQNGVSKQNTYKQTSIQNSTNKVSENPQQNQQQKTYKYKLPHNNNQVWQQSKQILINFANNKIKDAADFLEAIQGLIRIQIKAKNINLENLLYFLENLTYSELDELFSKILPFIARLALKIEQLFTNSFDILIQGQAADISFTKQQIACLITHMFFCTLSSQENPKLPRYNTFGLLYSKKSIQNVQKLKCIHNYFRRLAQLQSIPTNEFIMFNRLIYNTQRHGTLEVSKWEQSSQKLCEVTIKNEGNIEDQADCLQIDFANAYIGGGVLIHGCVQEEIRFVISPEMLVSMLITEKLEDPEALMIVGAEQFSKYKGYNQTFEFAGDFQDKSDIDMYNRKDITVLAIDAMNFSKSIDTVVQYKMWCILRELNKAYIGFCGSDMDQSIKPKNVATGRWGCGAFRGNAQLKFIIQWIAVSEANLEMVFLQYGDKDLAQAEEIVYKFKNDDVGKLFGHLKAYNHMTFHDKVNLELFEFLLDIV